MKAEVEGRQRLQELIKARLEETERRCLETFEGMKQQRDAVDQKLVQKLNDSIDLIQGELSKSLVNKHFSGQAEVDSILEKDIPKL